jgi:hypothetical protein
MYSININNIVRDEYKKILDAYTSPVMPSPKQAISNPNSTLGQAVSKPAIGPSGVPSKAEDTEESARILRLGVVDSDRKAMHAAYNIVDIIYRAVKDFDTATKIIKTIASVHKRERRRLSRS